MTYSALKSIDLTNFMILLVCFLVSSSKGGRHVSPVWTMAFRRILLSFSNCVQFKIIGLIVRSSFTLQGNVELGINLNLWRYDLIKPWPVTVAVNSAEIGNLVLILSFMYGKNNLLIAPFVQLVIAPGILSICSPSLLWLQSLLVFHHTLFLLCHPLLPSWQDGLPFHFLVSRHVLSPS